MKTTFPWWTRGPDRQPHAGTISLLIDLHVSHIRTITHAMRCMLSISSRQLLRTFSFSRQLPWQSSRAVPYLRSASSPSWNWTQDMFSTPGDMVRGETCRRIQKIHQPKRNLFRSSSLVPLRAHLRLNRNKIRAPWYSHLENRPRPRPERWRSADARGDPKPMLLQLLRRPPWTTTTSNQIMILQLIGSRIWQR